MITASHNPKQDNGIKCTDFFGEMLRTEFEEFNSIFLKFLSTLPPPPKKKKSSKCFHQGRKSGKGIRIHTKGNFKNWQKGKL